MKLNNILSFYLNFSWKTIFAKPFILGFYNKKFFIHAFRELVPDSPHGLRHMTINGGNFSHIRGIVKEPGVK
jgi:hypothetical protein